MRLRDVPQTSSPRAMSDCAIARPIPELAPVRKAFFIQSQIFPAARRLKFNRRGCTNCFPVDGCRSYNVVDVPGVLPLETSAPDLHRQRVRAFAVAGLVIA